jgi:pilus assembly protein CpaB
MRKRAGVLLIVSGLALAAVTAMLVMGIARQASAASTAQIRQVAVVVATRDIFDQTQVTADALEVKAFPADFAPPGAYSSFDDIVGKFARGFIPKGQTVVAGQLQLAQPAPNLSDRIAPGLVVMWLPMPDVLANDNLLKPGDRVDVLLTAPMKADADPEKLSYILSTQTTLQNVAIYRIGDDEFNAPAPVRPTSPTSGQSANGAAGSTTAAAAPNRPGRHAIGLLVDHQDAVTMKFVKDAGGTLDLVTRSGEDQLIVRTDGVTLDSLAERFRFRIPLPVQRTDATNQSR